MINYRFLFALVIALFPVSASAQKMYWTDSVEGQVKRANLDGTEVEVLANETGVFDVAIDTIRGKLYWTRPLLGIIRRANLDGTQAETVFEDEASTLAIDGQGRVYFSADGRIRRSDPDFTNVELIVSTPLTSTNITIDPTGNKIYWNAIFGADDNAIVRANLDGSDPEAILTGLEEARDVLVDPCERKVYWTGLRTINRANLDGTQVEEITSSDFFPWDLALDPRTQQILYTEPLPGRISSVTRDGSQVLSIVSGHRSGKPHKIVFDSPGEVLRIDGSSGFVSKPTNESLEITLDATSQGPGSPRYVLWFWPGQDFHPSRSLGTCFINPTPLDSSLSPQPFLCLTSLDLSPLACGEVNVLQGPSRAPFTITRPGGLGSPMVFTIQGVIESAGANSSGFIPTNPIVLEIR